MKKIITLILAALTCFSVVMTGCNNATGGTGDGSGSSEVKYYVYEDGKQYNDGIGEYDIPNKLETKTDYDKSVFYRNDIVGMAADPFALYCDDKTNEEDYDYYFLFGTTGNAIFNCFKSKDLISWEPESPAYAWPQGSWQSKDTWAPEVVYDPDADRAFYGVDDESVYGGRGTGCYFIVCSASGKAEYQYWTNQRALYKLDLAVAAQPQGPYRQWTGVEKGAVINGVDYGTEAGILAGYTYQDGTNLQYFDSTNTKKVARENDEVTIDDHWWNPAAARASLSFQWENRHLAGNYVLNGQAVPKGTEGATWVPEGAKYMVTDEGIADFACIDPNPWVDPVSGKKVIFLTRDMPHSSIGNNSDEFGKIFRGTCIYAVEMLNGDWAQPDYSTLTRISRTGFNFISDAARDQYIEDVEAYDPTLYPLGTSEKVENIPEMGLSTVEERIRPNQGNNINEGTQMLYNPDTGLYYLTFSMGSYTNDTYTVIQVVSYSLFGPYRKLEVGEGGHLLSTDNGKAMDNLSGPGHHTMVTLYDEEKGREPELIMLYHKHADMRVGGGRRGACVDRVAWVRNNNGLLVMHINGPTTYMQPRLYSTGETDYDNLALYEDTTITVSEPDKIVDDVHGVQNLNDNVIAVHTEYVDEDWQIPVEPYIHEFETTAQQVTVTVDLGAYYPVVAYMLYNSRQFTKMFKSYDYVNEADGKTYKWNDIVRVEMDIYKDGKKGIAVFEGLEFYTDFALFATGDKIRPGAAASAVFAEIAVKQIRFTIYNNNASGILALSEIAVLGKPSPVDVA